MKKFPAQVVSDLGVTRKRFTHQLVGPITLDCQILTSENLMERLVVFTATSGSEDAKQLALLAVIGTQKLHSEAIAAEHAIAADDRNHT